MSRKCQISGRGPLSGNTRSHALNSSRRKWNVNLQKATILVDGKPTKVRISAKELSTKDSATLVKEADDHFEKKAYAEAQALYTELLNRNYKPAKVNFNLGEIAYSQKSYTTAIEHYKSSIALFDKR